MAADIGSVSVTVQNNANAAAASASSANQSKLDAQAYAVIATNKAQEATDNAALAQQAYDLAILGL